MTDRTWCYKCERWVRIPSEQTDVNRNQTSSDEVGGGVGHTCDRDDDEGGEDDVE
jgi:hypothetical protein